MLGNDVKYLVEVNRCKPGERCTYERNIKGADKHLYGMTPRELRYVVGNKFMLSGNDENLNT